MKILIFNTPEEAAARVAAQITTTVQQNPEARLGRKEDRSICQISEGEVLQSRA